MIGQESKRSYFEAEISLDTGVREQKNYYKNTMLKVENQMDLFFDRVRASEEVLIKNLNDKSEISYLFKTNNRKRLGSVRNALEKMLGKEVNAIENIDCHNYKKQDFEKKLVFYKKDSDLSVKESTGNEYKGSDIEVFKDRKNYFSWQSMLEDMLFEKNSNVLKKAKDREIILFRCPKGNSGKSSFLKNLYFRNTKEISFIGEGSINQISSGVVNGGSKKCFLIDLPRTRSEDLRGLMASVEQIKNGICSKSMYGSGEVLVMEVPWIIICSNYIPLGSFSADRWKVYDLIPNRPKTDYKAKDVSDEMRKIAKDKILIDEYEVKEEERKIREKAKLIRTLLKKGSRKVSA